MKWHSLLKDPNDIPQRINCYEESEDVMVVLRVVEFSHKKLSDKYSAKFEYVVAPNAFYYGHWEPNGEEGWRIRGKDYSDCGKFGGFDTDTRFSEYQENHAFIKEEMDDLTPEAQEFVKKNCRVYDDYSYITIEIVGWTYYPNEEDFIEENKEFIKD